MIPGKKIILIITILIAMAGLSAQTVLVWNNEIASFHFTDPETENQVGGEYGITQALEVNNVNYQMEDTLPQDLSGFDAIIVLCGSWCVS